MMVDNYEINPMTLAILPIAKNVSKVIEMDQVLTVSKSTTEIIDDSCKYFCSSYQGRFEGTKKMIGVNYKSPIIIEESREIIFFPTSSPRFDNCSWISLNHIEEYNKDKKNPTIQFSNGEVLPVEISFGSLENQILRSIKLCSILRKRKQSEKIS